MIKIDALKIAGRSIPKSKLHLDHYVFMVFNRRMSKRYGFTRDNKNKELVYTRFMANNINYFKIYLAEREDIMGMSNFN